MFLRGQYSPNQSTDKLNPYDNLSDHFFFVEI